VIRFILQPLLENAIYHGIKEADGRRRIDVEVGESDGRLVLSVSDDGLGIPLDRLKEIHARLAEDEGGEPSLGSIGLFNTNKRIRLAFGDEYGIRILSVQGKGTRVDVVIPSRM
jgi:two-component system sensor histidine kinase YesM